MRRAVVVALTASAALALAACGGSSENAATSATTGSAAATTSAGTTSTPADTASTPAGATSTPESPPSTPESPPSDFEGDLAVRLPQVPRAAVSTHPTSPGGTGGHAFLTAVFDDMQAMWKREFAAAGIEYTPARLTIFRDSVHTACGTQSSSVGPFYCGADRGVYLDTRFFDALSRHVGVALGDFAQAYVVGHEVGHHVQLLLGIAHRVAIANQQQPAGTNARSVRVELQADCLAGIWKHASYARGAISADAIAEALRAAAVVGDDFQQRNATGTITPETWTHGSSAQRQHWLTVGFQEGRPSECDTFGQPTP